MFKSKFMFLVLNLD